MQHRIIFFLFGFLIFGSLNAQDDAFTKPMINDDMTVDPDQNHKWKMGEAGYSAKPKDMWELGIHAGSYFINGDVDTHWPNLGLGLHLRKAIHYAFSVRGDLFYGVATGLDPQRSSDAVMNIDLIPAVRDKVSDLYRNYKTKYFYGSIQGVLNIGNILFHQERNKWNTYMFLGIGLDNNVTKIDALNGNSAYNWSGVSGDVDTKAGRKQIKKDVRAILDGDYETDAREKKAIFRLNDKTNIHPMFQAGVGISRKINKRLNIGIEHQVMLSDNDLLDGFEYRSIYDQSNNNDVSHYTNIRLGINLGSFDKRTEPLYWLNPIDGALNDIAELKQRPVLDLTDSDGDGVIDMLDQEPNTVAGAPVDVRGIALDSDGDGVPDYQDKEPYSPPGYDVDANGVAKIDGPWVTEDEVADMINSRIANIKTEWFLPMIHFDLDKYYIKPEFYGQLHHVATVMKEHPEIKVVADGFADVRNTAEYNNVLSYKRAKASIDYLVEKYGIPRDRFILQYGGENEEIVNDLPDNHRTTTEQERMQYMNRRVEFRVAKPGDQEMAMPEGPDAGKNTPGSSRPGVKYSGNRNSGY
ncbi:MAG: OmpA family protein [Saprospiraceae bacterium]|nr:OmpA family protein [Saprospiraceae bacterium]MCB9321313.1 OmpA family protein [Lewinellaceae bacterium]